MNPNSNKAFLIVGLLLALAVRFCGLTSQSLTMDEAVELNIAQSNVQAIIVEPNSFPPLYHLLLKSWLVVIDNLQSARILSVAMGLLSLGFLYGLVREFVDEKVANCVLALGIVSPFHYFYSQEGRSYMLFFLLAAAAIWSALRLAKSYTHVNLAVFIFVAVLGAYTHYYFAILMVAVALGAASYFGFDVIPRFAVAAVIIGVLSLPSVFLLKGDLDFQKNLREPRPLNLVSTGYTFFSFASGYSLGLSRAELHGGETREAIVHAAPWLIVVVVGYGIPFVFGCLRLRRQAIFWGALLVVPLVAMAAACSQLGLTYNPRFSVWLWIPFVVICSAGLASLPRRSAFFLGGLIVAVSVAAIASRNLDADHRNEDVRSVAKFLMDKNAANVAVCAWYMAGPLELYIDPDAEPAPKIVETLDLSHIDGSEEAAIQQLTELREQGFWLVYSRAFHSDPKGKILDALKPDLEEKYTTAGVVVYRAAPVQQSD